ncbi:MAG: DUF4491 family protein [Paludibacteraceae bacterium]|nr:DUF4491 family protein [Paludibacteraceae bacterium]
MILCNLSVDFSGLIVGVCTFLIIGIYHPIVIKAEYYFGTRCWWAFLLVGLITLAASLFVTNMIVSIVLGVTAFSSFWGIKELFEQKRRVERGWFPRNPKRMQRSS